MTAGYDPVEAAALAPAALAAAVADGVAAFQRAADLAVLAAARTAHLGDASPVALAQREIGALPPAARKAAGERVNAARAELTGAYERRKRQLTAARDSAVLAAEALDVTLPASRSNPGARHPVSALLEEVADVLSWLGYEVVDGPEVEAEWFNFDALNIPRDHPARSLHDTLWVEPASAGVLLRTHTSPVQVRTLLTRTPPVYVAVPGRVFRADSLDATHSPVFHQVEALAIDEHLTMADLRGTLDHLAGALIGAGLTTRMRPHYFPFTEPSVEVDIMCVTCRGASRAPGAPACRTCSSTGWIEWCGAGMVHPAVLAAAGHDPDRFGGFAFGVGLDRTAMLRHHLADLRDLLEGDVRVSLALGPPA